MTYCVAIILRDINTQLIGADRAKNASVTKNSNEKSNQLIQEPTVQEEPQRENMILRISLTHFNAIKTCFSTSPLGPPGPTHISGLGSAGGFFFFFFFLSPDLLFV